MQTITIAGNIGKDAELRRTQGGDSVASFSVAVNNGRDNPATWWDVSIWGKRAETLSPMIRKGGRVTVAGRFSTREYEGKTYLQCSANEITLQSSRNEGGDQPTGPSGNNIDDEIPF